MDENEGADWRQLEENEHEHFLEEQLVKMENHALDFRRWLTRQRIIQSAGETHDYQ